MLRAIEIGIDHYLLKPLKVDKLFGLINRVRHSKAEAAQRRQTKEAHCRCEARHQYELRHLNKMLERRVRERTAGLEAAVRELEAFSYSVSHDLRAPLRHINCFSAMLAEDFGDHLPEHARGYLDRIGAASSRMGALIDHLLELSRVMRVGISPEPVDVSTLAASILAMLQETEPARRVDVVMEEGITVSGDPYLLRQLLENLLGNAWKYTSRKEVARIEFGSMQVAGEETIFVKDNGAGFDMAYQGGLFQVFQRLHGGEEFEGLGIGLATAHRIVQRHGGKIWAEAKVEEGATFYFTLPATSRSLTTVDTEERRFRLCDSGRGQAPAAYA
ncbi:MAG TPA: hybrid sensor histidine kinase/response regulator [Geobacter sp.]|nr:hybrid sensor histidine kinase/response regulator [Geobacter sp.]